MVIAILAAVLFLITLAALPTWRQIKSIRAAMRQPEHSREAILLRNATEYGTNIPYWLQRRQ